MQSSGNSIAEIAAFIDAALVGVSSNVRLTGLASLDSATASDLSFVVSEKHLTKAKHSAAGALILPPALVAELSDRALLCHSNPYLAYARASQLFAAPSKTTGISELASISDRAVIGEGVHIGAFTVIEAGARIGRGCCIESGCFIGENVQLGDDCYLFPRVSLYPDVLIGSRCRINSGSVIGSDGFGFAPSDEGWVKIYQLGRVVIGEGVEIGANVSISRGALDDTRIGDGVIIDDLVLIAHNVEIGDHTAIAGQVGIAGSSKVGKNCTFGGQVGVSGHLTIADGVHITGKSMITRSITNAGHYSSGMPALPSEEWRRNVARIKQLEKMADRLSALEKEFRNKARD